MERRTNPPARTAGGLARRAIGERPGDDRGAVEGALEADGAAAAEAAEAVGSLLTGFGLDPGPCSGVVERLLTGADALGRTCPDKGTVCALTHAEQQLEVWLCGVLGPEVTAGGAALPIGRAAFLSCGGPTTWPHLILANDPPEAFVAAMRAAAPPLAPVAAPGDMAAQSLESWSIAHLARAATDFLGGGMARMPNARSLLAATLKLTRPTS